MQKKITKNFNIYDLLISYLSKNRKKLIIKISMSCLLQ